MLLAEAIKKNTASLASAQNTYKQNVVVVNSLVTSVFNSTLPTLNQYPPDWNEFTTAYEQASSYALDWVNNVMVRLLSVPEDVRNYNTIITTLLQDAQQQASLLVNQPSNQGALASLNQDLNSLSSQLNIITSFIAGALSSIQEFQNDLPQMAADLQTIATDAANDANADQQQIQQLQTQIDQLNQDIQKMAEQIIVLGIADAGAIILGSVATIAAWPVGAVVWLFAGPAVIVASTFIVLDSIQLAADVSAVNAAQQQMSQLTADVSTLNLLAQNYSTMATQTQKIEDNLQQILAAWQVLENDVNAAKADIQAATSDSNSADFTAVEQDLSNAVVEWNAAYQQAGALELNIQANTAQLGVGMSQSQIQEATSAGQTIDIITYYNSYVRA